MRSEPGEMDPDQSPPALLGARRVREPSGDAPAAQPRPPPPLPIRSAGAQEGGEGRGGAGRGDPAGPSPGRSESAGLRKQPLSKPCADGAAPRGERVERREGA